MQLLNNQLLEIENQVPDTLKYVTKNQALLIQESKGKTELTLFQFLARFLKEGLIGKGTISSVMKYNDTLNNKLVAVKYLQLTSQEQIESQ